MNFSRTSIPDVILCEPTVHGDTRGYFFESFRQDQFEAFIGHKVNFCQDNESKSNKRDFIPSDKFIGYKRGFHFKKGNKGLGYYKENI